MISTQRMYYQDFMLNTCDSIVLDVGQDVDGVYAVFDKTLFHPQGGGQPDDQGFFKIGNTVFTLTKLTEGKQISVDTKNPTTFSVIKHYFNPDQKNQIKPKDVAIHVINMEARLLYSRLHSAGHLLANAVNILYPNLVGCAGNHFPKESFVFFEGTPPENKEEFKNKIDSLVNKFVEQKLILTNNWKENPRSVKFGDMQSFPCGGTHVSDTSIIGNITIRNIKSDKKQGKSGIRLGYDIK